MFLEQKKGNNLPGEITKASECPVWVKIPYRQPGNKTHSLCPPCSKLQPAAVAIPLPRSQASPPGSRHEQPEAAPHAPAGLTFLLQHPQHRAPLFSAGSNQHLGLQPSVRWGHRIALPTHI